MRRRLLAPALLAPALLAIALSADPALARLEAGSPDGQPTTATAVRSGGLRLSEQGIAQVNAKRAHGLMRPVVLPPRPPAPDPQPAMQPQQRRDFHRKMVAKLRGDPGHLLGFSFGEPLAPSLRPPPPRLPPPITIINAPFVQNNFGSNVRIDLQPGDAPDQEGAPGGEETTARPAVAPDLGNISFTNVNSNVNAAIGTGNTAGQTIGPVPR